MLAHQFSHYYNRKCQRMVPEADDEIPKDGVKTDQCDQLPQPIHLRLAVGSPHLLRQT